MVHMMLLAIPTNMTIKYDDDDDDSDDDDTDDDDDDVCSFSVKISSKIGLLCCSVVWFGSVVLHLHL